MLYLLKLPPRPYTEENGMGAGRLKEEYERGGRKKRIGRMESEEKTRKRSKKRGKGENKRNCKRREGQEEVGKKGYNRKGERKRGV